MATQQEIADRLEISRSLVARALSDTPGARVSPDTRQRVLRVAKELGYSPNSAARALRTGRSSSVSFIQSARNGVHTAPSFNAAVEGCSRALGLLGYDLKVRFAAGHDDLMAELTNIGASHSSDLIILWGPEGDVEEQGELLQQIGVPFVVKGHHEARHPEWLQIDFDHSEMIRRATIHVSDMGHSRIGYIGYDTDDVFAQRLLDGFKATHVELFGMQPDDRFIARVDSSRSANKLVIEQWMSYPREQRPTGLVIGANANAWTGVELALCRHGLKMGDLKGEFAVSGLASQGFFTLFGTGHYYPANDIVTLGSEMVNRLIVPALRGETPQCRAIRLMPDFLLSECLDLG